MNTFVPFLMLPLMGVAGWQLSGLYTPPPSPPLPVIATLEAPPALGVTVPYAKDRTPVRVSMGALLPPAESAPVRPTAAAMPHPALMPPAVTAILIHGERRVAQVDNTALAVGDGLGDFRVTAIEAERVLFENTSQGQLRWVAVTR